MQHPSEVTLSHLRAILEEYARLQVSVRVDPWRYFVHRLFDTPMMMLPLLRAKMRVTSITEKLGWEGTKQVCLQMVYDPETPDGARFLKGQAAGGQLELTIDTPQAMDRLHLGATFYLDLNGVPGYAQIERRQTHRSA
jgi:hypothetical protein